MTVLLTCLQSIQRIPKKYACAFLWKLFGLGEYFLHFRKTISTNDLKASHYLYTTLHDIVEASR